MALHYIEDGKSPKDRLNVWDRIRAWGNPVEGLIRMKAREIEHRFSYGYEDDERQRERSGGLFAHASAETWRSNRDRLKAMWDARDLVQFDFIGGMVARIILYTCGQFHSVSDTGVAQLDEVYDTYFHNWCGDEADDDGLIQCDITGRHRFSKMVQLAFAGYIVDGDAGLLEIDPMFSPTGKYALQSIEADRIGSPLEQLVQENYVGGVGIDPNGGRIQFYRIFERTRTNQYKNPKEILPYAFIHVHDSDRADEYRGRTKLLRMLPVARDIREWANYEMMAGKTQSQWAALIGVKDPFLEQSEQWKTTTGKGTPTQKAQWGQLLRMAEGEIFSMLAPPSRPTGAFMEFIQFSIRKLSIAFDMPYGFLWDLATLGGVTARVEVQQAMRKIEMWQNQILVNKILNRVRNKVLANAIAQGELPPHPRFNICEWHFGLSIQTDVAYEADSDIKMAATGIIPVSEIMGKYGHNPREIFRSNATTINTAIEEGAMAGVPVEAIAPGLYPNVTEQKAAMLTPPIPPPEPGTFDAVGDKGVKQIVDILKAVGEGKMDKDAALHTLEHTYGIPPAIAKKMIPDEPSTAKMKAIHGTAQPAAAKVSTTKKTTTKKKKK